MLKNGDVREDGRTYISGKWYSRRAIRNRKAGSNAYMKRVRKSATNFTGQDLGKCTAACESLVQADLLNRGFDVTKPLSPTSKHDLHADIPSVGWKGVQVKAAVKNSVTGHLRPASNKPCKSPIFALVFLPFSVVYRAGTEPLPSELEVPLAIV